LSSEDHVDIWLDVSVCESVVAICILYSFFENLNLELACHVNLLVSGTAGDQNFDWYTKLNRWSGQGLSNDIEGEIGAWPCWKPLV
jgi:hypothetical protein